MFGAAGVPEEARPAVLAMSPLSVVAAVVTHTAAASARGQPKPSVEVAAVSVAIALAL